jgi:hypothetical protein
MGVQDRPGRAENQPVTTARCPACGASVALGAPWCTLCYADLRPAPKAAPAPVPEMVPEMVPASASAAPLVDALGIIPPPPLPAAAPLPPDPHLDAPITKAADIRLAPPGWPCRNCNVVVPMSEDNCPQCHTPFLVPEDVVEISLPVVGNVRRLDTKMRTILGLAGALGIMVVLLIVAFIAGAIL